MNWLWTLIMWRGAKPEFIEDVTHEGQRYIIRATGYRKGFWYQVTRWKIAVRLARNDPFGRPVYETEVRGDSEVARLRAKEVAAALRSGVAPLDLSRR